MTRSAIQQGLAVTLLVVALLTAAASGQEAAPGYVIRADGLACPFCAYGIEKQLGAVDGVTSVETDIRSGTVTVTMRPGATLDEAVARAAVEAAGFTMRGFARQDVDQ